MVSTESGQVLVESLTILSKIVIFESFACTEFNYLMDGRRYIHVVKGSNERSLFVDV